MRRGLEDAAGGKSRPPAGGLSSPGRGRLPPPRARAGAAGWAPRHGGPERPELPPAARVGVRLPGPPVPQQPLLHGGQGDRVLRGGRRRGVQPAGAPAEVLPGPQRRHHQVRGAGAAVSPLNRSPSWHLRVLLGVCRDPLLQGASPQAETRQCLVPDPPW